MIIIHFLLKKQWIAKHQQHQAIKTRPRHLRQNKHPTFNWVMIQHPRHKKRRSINNIEYASVVMTRRANDH